MLCANKMYILFLYFSKNTNIKIIKMQDHELHLNHITLCKKIYKIYFIVFKD